MEKIRRDEVKTDAKAGIREMQRERKADRRTIKSNEKHNAIWKI